MTIQIGVVENTNEEYHASEGISRTMLWKFKQLPYKFWHEYLSGDVKSKEDKESFDLGNLVHAMTLEPAKTGERYALLPSIDRRTKAGKDTYEHYMKEYAGKKLIKSDVWEQASHMSWALLKNNTVNDLISNARVEQSIYWEHKKTGIICKARPDAWQKLIVSDIKTTQDASYKAFQSSAYKYGYFLQAGMIYEALLSIGAPFKKFVFACVEKTAPFSVGIYMLDDEALEFGREMFHALMERFAKCKESDNWPDYGVHKLCVPKYASLDVELDDV